MRMNNKKVSMNKQKNQRPAKKAGEGMGMNKRMSKAMEKSGQKP